MSCKKSLSWQDMHKTVSLRVRGVRLAAQLKVVRWAVSGECPKIVAEVSLIIVAGFVGDLCQGDLPIRERRAWIAHWVCGLGSAKCHLPHYAKANYGCPSRIKLSECS